MFSQNVLWLSYVLTDLHLKSFSQGVEEHWKHSSALSCRGDGYEDR